MPRMQLPAKMQPFLQKDKRFKVAFGGRGSGKSTGFGKMGLMRAQTHGTKMMCLREMQNSISDSVHALLRDEIEGMELTGFEVTDKAIRFNGQDAFKFRGMARNPDAIKSSHGFDVAWVEEAQAVSKESLRLLTPTLRTAGSEIWLSLNPMSSADPVSQRFLLPFQQELDRDGYYEDDDHLIIKVNWRDNPWFPEELERERQWDFDNLPRAVYDHIWEGAFLDQVDDSIILPEWFDACIDAHKKLGFKPTGAKVVTHDPSDKGTDAKGLSYRHGSVFLDVTEWQTGCVNTGCDWATDYALSVGADYFLWDCDGLGVSLRRQISEALGPATIDFQEFKGSMAVDWPTQAYDKKAQGGRPKSNKDTFKNKRSQYYWALRDRMYNTYRAVVLGEYQDPGDMISISSKIKLREKLRSELCRIPLQQNNNGLIQLMSKPDMKRLLKIESPNMADSMMMSLALKTNAPGKRQVNIPTIRAKRLSR